jgi:predicted metal-dependent phosphoesterase TrpH
MDGVPRYDLHLHTRRSYDCLMTPRGIVARARRAGLAGVAVTDHDTIAGGLETRALAPGDLLVIVGAEIHTRVGDIVCLFLTREIETRDPIEVIAETRRQGGVAFLPHPLRSHPPVIADAVLDACAGYEVLNSRAGWFSPETAPVGQTDWRRLAGKARLGCSDAHFYSEIGRAYTLIQGPVTEETVRLALLGGSTVPGGTRGPARNFYLSQMVKLGKTRDVGMLWRLARRLWRRVR